MRVTKINSMRTRMYRVLNVFIIISLIQCMSSNTCFGQATADTIYLSPKVELEEVIVFGENKIKTTRLGYLNKENFQLSLYEDYEIGVYVQNNDGFQNIEDVYLKVNNELDSTCEIQLNFYNFDGKPTKLITSIKASINPNNKKKQIISSNQIKVKFPEEGIFISTKILSALKKEDASHFRIYLTEKYADESTFIRGSIYGENWSPLSKLKIRQSDNINACYGFYATK